MQLVLGLLVVTSSCCLHTRSNTFNLHTYFHSLT